MMESKEDRAKRREIIDRIKSKLDPEEEACVRRLLESTMAISNEHAAARQRIAELESMQSDMTNILVALARRESNGSIRVTESEIIGEVMNCGCPRETAITCKVTATGDYILSIQEDNGGAGVNREQRHIHNRDTPPGTAKRKPTLN